MDPLCDLCGDRAGELGAGPTCDTCGGVVYDKHRRRHYECTPPPLPPIFHEIRDGLRAKVAATKGPRHGRR